uniref:Uncharacterized protein n=1 Tax=Monopterus albus TaxID=43700 RepID=A0A3Q3IQI4_MONAL
MRDKYFQNDHILWSFEIKINLSGSDGTQDGSVPTVTHEGESIQIWGCLCRIGTFQHANTPKHISKGVKDEKGFWPTPPHRSPLDLSGFGAVAEQRGVSD